jgi:hypothetical protein
MSAFDKVLSGLSGMDEMLDFIRLGDNVVWRVSSIEEYAMFVAPYVKQAIADGRNLIYIRFAQHAPLCEPMPGLKIYEFNPDVGFEAFTVAIHDCITREGRDSFYVFDSLSELQSAWYTDLMMGNFFRVTCPYLFILDPVAYFPLIRARHSFDAVARIRDTTQLMLDVYTGDDMVYLHPLKVWNRYSDRMFLPHSAALNSGDFRVLEGGVAMGRYYQLLERETNHSQNLNFDSHDRFFAMAKLAYSQGEFSEETEQQIIESTMSRDTRMQTLLKHYFTPRDYFTLRDKMVGSGSIGGKACGMLLARKIAEKHLENYREHFEAHDSFYIGSDVFYTYIVSNNCWNTRIEQRTSEGYFEKADELKTALLAGVFPSNIREQFRNLLDYFGQSPIIVRSSSFLEDGFGNAFAGKYESVFCVNQGTPAERLECFEQAVRTVYASTMDVSALEYRVAHSLQNSDEQMAVLVQRVSGSYYGQYFMPCAAGVGYSHSAYKWRPDMDPAAGMLRLVMGLGTKAVDRTENDYPRLVNLDSPATTMMTTAAERHRFSQRNIDVLDNVTNTLHDIPLNQLLSYLPRWYMNLVLDHDYEAEFTLRNMGQSREVLFVSCQKLLENKSFTGLMQDLLKTLERVYETPVDIEYTVNLDSQGDFAVNLLQCRPLYTGREGGTVEIPSVAPEKVFFELIDSSMGSSADFGVDAVIQVDAKAYYEYPYNKKSEAANAIGCLNSYYKNSGKRVLLLVPGRIGTSSPELGVPVRFADISGFCGICEVSDSRAGYMPELSYGSHMFQDLVEAEILYSAIFNNEKTLCYQEDLFAKEPDLYEKICPQYPQLKDMFRVTEPQNLRCRYDAATNHIMCARGNKMKNDE